MASLKPQTTKLYHKIYNNKKRKRKNLNDMKQIKSTVESQRTMNSTEFKNNKYLKYKEMRTTKTFRRNNISISTQLLSTVILILIWNNCVYCMAADNVNSNSILSQNSRSNYVPESCYNCEPESLGNIEEYMQDHIITRQQATNALKNLSSSYFKDGNEEHSCGGIQCTKNIMTYCLGPHFINDHCWCEQGHSEESMPFIPHICYISEKYTPTMASCFLYDEIRKCCCAPALANNFRYLISAASQPLKKSLYLLKMSGFTIFALYFLVYR